MIAPFMMGTTSSTIMQTSGQINRRSPAAGAMIWCLYVFLPTGLPGSTKLPVLNLFKRPKINQHFRPAGATRCTDSREIWHGRRARGSGWPIKISYQSVHAAPKVENFHFW